jgi:DNA-binding PadR family transcriptional regulator
MSLPHAILGFLSIRPMTGYDLKRMFDQSVAHFWRADQAQIYRALARHVEQGRARVELVEQEERPSRKVHHLTNAGVRELRGWLSTFHEPAPLREGLLVQVFFGQEANPEDFDAVLVRHIEERSQQLEVLEAMHVASLEAWQSAGRPRRAAFQLATLEYGLRAAQAELDWLRETRQRLM